MTPVASRYTHADLKCSLSIHRVCGYDTESDLICQEKRKCSGATLLCHETIGVRIIKKGLLDLSMTSNPEKHGSALIVDDDAAILTAFSLLLKPHLRLVETERDPHNIEKRLKTISHDVIFLDMNFAKGSTTGEEGFLWLNRILKIDPTAIVILITAYGDIETAVRAIKEGATDFVVKPWQNEKILATLSSALKLRESQVELAASRNREKVLSADLDQPFHEIIGKSTAMLQIFETIRKVAGTEANILILGENGTGKELVARAIHRFSMRAESSFIAVDMGAISETLFESELFGHEKGAFTGASNDRMGRFEIASRGTLFLDEIGNLPFSLQAKLLAVVERREITRVGSDRPRPIDIRLITATNMPIHEMVAQKKFREDLLYRINTVEINLPPLSHRVEDIPLLVEHFVQLYGRKYQKPGIRVSPESMRVLSEYQWPGNVRELQHVIERAVILSESDSLHPEEMILKPAAAAHPDNAADHSLDEIEKKHVEMMIKKHDGNVTEAAKELGLTRTALYRRIKKYGI